ncbi:uncharacterized protein BXZ73DRAFT_77408 [Epithele typhae]|uniref:uncharacterized protein n=1 Tax=Epithele typhae TaxID=378194 RepID=UPI00200855A8|nr:uncharacterized protein BXZ73DRAFT_77408 [Epithele typhae]KAH9932690.1 hypothetical protein BXZ73DRAFT_77408 [Epithele typhae]
MDQPANVSSLSAMQMPFIYSLSSHAPFPDPSVRFGGVDLQTNTFGAPESVPTESQSTAADSAGSTIDGKRQGKVVVPPGSFRIPMVKVLPKETSLQSYLSTADMHSNSHYKRLAVEMEGHFLGPMPVQSFLRHFLGLDRIDMQAMPYPVHAFRDVPKEPPREGLVYFPLTMALNADPNTDRESRCPGFVFYVTANRADQSGAKDDGLNAVKPDICAYPEAFVARFHNQLDADGYAPTDMGLAALYIEVKKNETDDSFVRDWSPADAYLQPPPISFTRSTEPDEDLGQIINYASEIFKRQHRQHLFSVSLCGSKARLIRWDRAGAIAERGFDTTVEPATPNEEKLFGDAINVHLSKQVKYWHQGPATDAGTFNYYKDEHYEPYSVTSIPLPHLFPFETFRDPDPANSPDPSQSPPPRLLVSRPIVVPHSLTGRGVRIYWAARMERRRSLGVVLLKDFWRYSTRRTEGEVLKELDDFKVTDIPTALYHSDVPGHRCGPSNVEAYPTEFGFDPNEKDVLEYCSRQATLTQDYANAEWVYPSVRQQLKLTRMVHYRLVIDEAGYPLTRAVGTQELLSGARDALRAITTAFFNVARNKQKVAWVHRNVSPRNIMLFRDRTKTSRSVKKGYLINWDTSSSAPRLTAQGPRLRPDDDDDPPVSVEYQFSAFGPINAMYARNTGWTLDSRQPSIYYTVIDDIDALLYSVLYCALKCTDHKLGKSLENLIFGLLFPEVASTPSPGTMVAPLAKENFRSRVAQAHSMWSVQAMRSWMTLAANWSGDRANGHNAAVAVEPTDELQNYIAELRKGWDAINNAKELFGEFGKTNSLELTKHPTNIKWHKATSTATSFSSANTTVSSTSRVDPTTLVSDIPRRMVHVDEQKADNDDVMDDSTATGPSDSTVSGSSTPTARSQTPAAWPQGASSRVGRTRSPSPGTSNKKSRVDDTSSSAGGGPRRSLRPRK